MVRYGVVLGKLDTNLHSLATTVPSHLAAILSWPNHPTPKTTSEQTTSFWRSNFWNSRLMSSFRCFRLLQRSSRLWNHLAVFLLNTKAQQNTINLGSLMDTPHRKKFYGHVCKNPLVISWCGGAFSFLAQRFFQLALNKLCHGREPAPHFARSSQLCDHTAVFSVERLWTSVGHVCFQAPVGGHQALHPGDFRKLRGREGKPFFGRNSRVFFFSVFQLFFSSGLSASLFLALPARSRSSVFILCSLFLPRDPWFLRPASFFAAPSFCCSFSSPTLVFLFLALSSPLVFHLSLFSRLLRGPIRGALPVDRIFPNKPLPFFFPTAIGFWIILVNSCFSSVLLHLVCVFHPRDLDSCFFLLRGSVPFVVPLIVSCPGPFFFPWFGWFTSCPPFFPSS